VRAKVLLLLLPAALLLASCSYSPSVTEVTLPVGSSTTITITEYHWFSGSLIAVGGVSVFSSAASIFTLDQDPTLRSTSVTIHGLRPGTGSIKATSSGASLVTVNVTDACTPVSVEAAIPQVQALLGIPVALEVIPHGFHPIGTTWYQETGSGWSAIPSATGNIYGFLPQASGTFRFMARYSDTCGEASAIITVVVGNTPPIQPSVTSVLMLPGESTTITISTLASVNGKLIPVGGAAVVSTNSSVLRLEQDPTLQSPNVTLHALQPGDASIQTADRSRSLVAVHVESCSPVSVHPQTTQVQMLVGSAVELRVIVDDPTIVGTWFEEKGGIWSPIPFGIGNVYNFRPMFSGTFRFLVRYSDHCDDVSTMITVVASTRGHATRH
jgi:hypothetical protein